MAYFGPRPVGRLSLREKQERKAYSSLLDTDRMKAKTHLSNAYAPIGKTTRKEYEGPQTWKAHKAPEHEQGIPDISISKQAKKQAEPKNKQGLGKMHRKQPPKPKANPDHWRRRGKRPIELTGSDWRLVPPGAWKKED